VKALTELSLAVFSLQDFNFISTHYPTCIQMMQINSVDLKKLQENQFNENIRVKSRAKTTSAEFKRNRHQNDRLSINIDSVSRDHSEIIEMSPSKKTERLKAIRKKSKNSKISLFRTSEETWTPLEYGNRSFNNVLMTDEKKKKPGEKIQENQKKNELMEPNESNEEPNQILENEENKGNKEKTKKKEKKTEVLQSENVGLVTDKNPQEMILFPVIHEESSRKLANALPIKHSCVLKLWKTLKTIIEFCYDKMLANTFYLNLNLFIATTYSSIYYPIYLSYINLSFDGFLLFMEIYCIFIYIWSFLLEYGMAVKKYRKSKRNFKYLETAAHLFYEIMLIIPFCFIFEIYSIDSRRKNIILLILSLLRVTNFNQKLWIFKGLKTNFPALGKFLETILIYIDISHLIACLFMALGRLNPNFNYTWFVKIPAPQLDFPNNYREKLIISDNSIYVHALYWSYVTSSHIGLGDVCPISWEEKLLGTIVMIITTFTYIAFFGNMASLFQDLVNFFNNS